MLFASLRAYRAAGLPADLVAGALLAALAIPEQFATSRLAGMPPEAGLVAFVAGTLAVVVFGANRFLSVGADSTIAPIFAVTISGFAVAGSREYALYVGLVALLVGVMLILAGVFRAGWISDLLSIPVTIGFLAGISVQIVISQLSPLLGVAQTQTAAVPRVVEIVRELPQANPVAFALGVAVLAIILISRRLSAKIPGAILAFMVAGIAVAVLHLQRRVAVMGPLHARVPHLSLPIAPAQHLGQIVALAAVVAVVCTVQTVTTVRTFRSVKGIVDPSRDLVATGAGSILAALAGSFAVDASPPRTAVMQSAGATSQLAGLVAVIAVVAFMTLGSGLTQYVPEAALAGVLIFIATEIFRVSEMRRIARESRPEIVLMVLAAALVVFLPINAGMMLSILLSLFYGVYVMVRPPCVELVRVPGTTIWWPPSGEEPGERRPGIVVFSPAAPLYFMNVRYVMERLNAAVLEAPAQVRVVVIEGSGVIDIDYTGAHVFRSAVESLRRRGIRVALARLSEKRARAAAERTGLLAAVGSDCVFKSVEEAVDALAPR